LKVRQKTNYPWDGSVEITVTPAEPAEFTFFIRIPGWTDSAQVGVNGKSVSGAAPGQYLPIRRRWSGGDVIRVQFNMKPQLLESNAQVIENNGRVAVERGPLVYCLEQIDQPQGVALKDVALNLGVKSSAPFQEEFQKDLLGGVLLLHHAGATLGEAAEHSHLYFRYSGELRKSKPVSLTFIPYYAWANRTATPMQVWTPVSKV
jgi:DUF1680 family protein